MAESMGKLPEPGAPYWKLIALPFRSTTWLRQYTIAEVPIAFAAVVVTILVRSAAVIV